MYFLPNFALFNYFISFECVIIEYFVENAANCSNRMRSADLEGRARTNVDDHRWRDRISQFFNIILLFFAIF